MVVNIEKIDSCGGFYGGDYLQNGMADYFPLLREEECTESEATE